MRRFWLQALIVAGGVACTDPAGPQLSVLAVTPAAAELVLGDTVRLSAIGLSAAGDTMRNLVITWASNDTLVATVSATGLVTGRGQGSATITAASGAISGPATIAVIIHFAAVAAGGDHTCALTADGVAYCWGENYSGQLGDGSTSSRSVPAAVGGGHRFVALDAGSSFTCGLDADSLAWCWGLNAGGELGTGTQDNVAHPAPVPVAGGHHFRELSATWRHACGVTTQGAGYCWGFNQFGVLGTATPPGSITPTPALVTGGFAFNTAQTAAAHTCGVTIGGATLCWGANSYGELGAVTDTAFTSPVSLADTLALTGLAAGGNQACAIGTGGAAVCWGTMEIGEGYLYRRNPQPSASGLNLVQIAAAYSTTCGLDQAGAAWCYGSNWFGEVGDGTSLPRYPQVLVSGGHAFGSLGTGDNFTCALDGGGAAYCWGTNWAGQLGRGSIGGSDSVPVAVPVGITFQSIVPGLGHVCGIAADSSAWCWGDNQSGELGDSSTIIRSEPVMVHGGLKFVALAATGARYHAFTCGLTTTGAAYCWGNGSTGQLGTGSTASSAVPVPVTGGLAFTRITAGGPGDGFTCGLSSGGAAYCWGGNTFGTLGRGDTVSSSTPVAVAGGLSFTDIAAGGAFVCGRTGAGAVYCWGNNSAGQMGQGSLGIESLRPIPVQGASAFKRVAVGQSHSCGLAADSTASCWGRNWEGQLGTGDSVSSIAPRAVVGGLRFKQLVLGYTQSCGLTAAGAAYCWGEGGASAPGPIQPGTSFLSLSAGGLNRFCGVRADSIVVCVGPTAGTAARGPITAFSNPSGGQRALRLRRTSNDH